jgi:hypothetical protein
MVSLRRCCFSVTCIQSFSVSTESIQSLVSDYPSSLHGFHDFSTAKIKKINKNIVKEQTGRIFIIIHEYKAHYMSTRPVYLADNPCNAIYLVFYDVCFVRERGI